MAIKGQSLTINMYAFSITNNLPASGLTDISGYVIKDGGSPTALTNSVSEPSATNVPGVYEVTLSSTEMDADWITVGGKSYSNPTGVVVYPVMIATERGHFDLISGKLPTNYIMGSSDQADYDDSITNIESHVITISGYTENLEAGQTTIQSQISELPDIDTIVLSGNAENWSGVADVSALALQSTLVTVSGDLADKPDINTIVSSGDAAGWGSTAQVDAIVSGIFDEVINGTKDYRSAFEEIWTYAVGNIEASGSNPYQQTYQDMADDNLFTLNISGQGRTRTY